MNPVLLRLLLIVAPCEAREWISAIVNEAGQAEPHRRSSWLIAAGMVALASRIRGSRAALEGVALATAMLLVDWTSGDLLPALGLIGLSAIVLTRHSADHRMIPLFIAGGTLPVAHAVANWVPRLRPHYQYAPLDLRDWAVLAAIAAAGICAVSIADLVRGRSIEKMP